MFFRTFWRLCEISASAASFELARITADVAVKSDDVDADGKNFIFFKEQLATKGQETANDRRDSFRAKDKKKESVLGQESVRRSCS